MSDRLCEAQDIWPQDYVEICETSIMALVCHIVQWKQQHPETCVISAYVTREQDDNQIWCKLVFIKPYEQG